MVCSLCGSKGVNKSSCPLNVKNPTRENWIKHPNARPKKKKRIVIKRRPVKPQPIKRNQTFGNPYLGKMNQVCTMSQKLVNSMTKSRINIVLTGRTLMIYNIGFRNPDRFRIRIHNMRKLREFLNLYCDIYKRIAGLVPDRMDYFQKPSTHTNKLLTMLSNIRTSFIEFLISNIDGDGGMREGMNLDLNAPLDDIIGAMEANKILPDVTSHIIPEAPTTTIAIPKKGVAKKRAVMLKR